MQKPFVSKLLASICAALTATATYPATSQDKAPTFESVFATNGEPSTLHYTVQFSTRDGRHTMQVWRDGDTRLRRRTDDALDTYVIRDATDPTDYQMIVVDYDKHITTRIDRNNLVRLGRFLDWFDLAHGLKHPIGPYRIMRSEAPPKVDAPLSACRWYQIEQGDARHRVCWSERDRLPLSIWTDSQGEIWRVSAVDHTSLPANTFELHDAGFVRNDANQDIDSD